MECTEAEEREAGNLGTCARVHVCKCQYMRVYVCLWRVPDNRRRYLGENSKPVIMSGRMTCIDKVSSDGFGLIS